MTATSSINPIAGACADPNWRAGVDKEGTLERLKAHRRELTDPKSKEHRCRIDDARELHTSAPSPVVLTSAS